MYQGIAGFGITASTGTAATLAYTGSDVLLLAEAGVVVLVAGAFLLRVAFVRRRRSDRRRGAEQ